MFDVAQSRQDHCLSIQTYDSIMTIGYEYIFCKHIVKRVVDTAVYILDKSQKTEYIQ